VSNKFHMSAKCSGLIDSEPCRFEESIKDVYEKHNFYEGSFDEIMDIYFEFSNYVDMVNLAQ